MTVSIQRYAIQNVPFECIAGAQTPIAAYDETTTHVPSWDLAGANEDSFTPSQTSAGGSGSVDVLAWGIRELNYGTAIDAYDDSFPERLKVFRTGSSIGFIGGGDVSNLPDSLEILEARGQTTLGGDITSKKDLRTLILTGNNTVFGDLSDMDMLVVFLSGSCSCVADVTNWTNAVQINMQGDSVGNGDISGLSAITVRIDQGIVTGSLDSNYNHIVNLNVTSPDSQIIADISTWTSVKDLKLWNSTMVTGAIDALVDIEELDIEGPNTISGLSDPLTKLRFIRIKGGNSTAGGDLFANNPDIEYVQTLDQTTFGGDFSNRTKLNFLNMQGDCTAFGSVTLLTSLTNLRLQGQCAPTGDPTQLPLLTFIRCQANTDFTADLGNIPANKWEYCWIEGPDNGNLTVSAVPNVAPAMNTYRVVAGLATTEVNRLINSAASVTSWNGDAAVYFAGSNDPAAEGTATAQATIQARGATVTVN